MSKTDKDVPYRVRAERDGTIHHRHDNGPCTLGNPNVHTRREFGAHRATCAKQVTVTPVCTKAEPYNQSDPYAPRTCWRNLYTPSENDPMQRHLERQWVGCVGHREEIRYDATIPCLCDSWVRETCYAVTAHRGWRSDLPNPSRRAKVRAKVRRALRDAEGRDDPIADPPKMWRD